MSMIRLKFNETKATQVAALFLKKNHGKMKYMKLIKLLYLADREALKRWERPLTGDSYFSMKHGPILSNILDKISQGSNPKKQSYWHSYITNPSDYSVALRGEPEEDELSKREVDLIEEIYQQYKTYDRWKMVDICHEILPEWQDPGESSVPIRIEDILRVLNKTEMEIAIIEEELLACSYCDFILSGHQPSKPDMSSKPRQARRATG
jgi:uncharacterized phage-associated protein